MTEPAVVNQKESFHTYNCYGDYIGVVRGTFVRADGPVKVINDNLKLRIFDIDTGSKIEPHFVPV